jgi:GT2 family glycosyltransferase
MQIPEISIVIPNFNGEALLPACLQAVTAAVSCYRGKCEIIVVDDASEDDSVNLIVSKFPNVKLVRHQVNRGFAEAVTTGIQAANTEIVILLNTDARPDKFFISPLIRWFVRDDIFSVSPLIYGDEGGKLGNVSLNQPQLSGGDLRERAWDLQPIAAAVNAGKLVNSLYASGGSVALRKTMFLQLGGFLELFKPFYSEDQDLGTRAWRRGWRTVLEPNSKLVHYHGGTITRLFTRQRIKMIQQRNRLLFIWLHVSPLNLSLYFIPKTLLRLLIRTLQLDSVYVGGLLLAVGRLPEVIRLRRTFSKMAGMQSFEAVLDGLSKIEEVAGLPPPDWAYVNSVLDKAMP